MVKSHLDINSCDWTVIHKTTVHSLTSDMQTWVAHTMKGKTIACFCLSCPLALFFLCVCVFTYCGIKEQRSAELGERMRTQWWDLERTGSSKVLLRALLYGVASRSYSSISPRCEAVLQATTMGIFVSSTITFTHYWQWQETVVCQRSDLMSSRYELEKKIIETCRNKLTSF